MRVPSARVTSTVASNRTLRDRTQRLSDMREMVSGGSSAAQLSREMAVQTTEECNKLLDELFKRRGKLIIHIPAESLALKSDLWLPWAKLSEMRRYMYMHSVRLCYTSLYLYDYTHMGKRK